MARGDSELSPAGAADEIQREAHADQCQCRETRELDSGRQTGQQARTEGEPGASDPIVASKRGQETAQGPENREQQQAVQGDQPGLEEQCVHRGQREPAEEGGHRRGPQLDQEAANSTSGMSVPAIAGTSRSRAGETSVIGSPSFWKS